jgi:hypothetical protein
MGNADAVNPLGRIGARSWIVVLPKPDDSDHGKLIVNPDPRDRSGYTLFHTDELLRRLPGAGGFHDAISGCLVNEDTHKNICGPTLLDTGAPGLHITSSRPADLAGWRAGSHMAIAFKGEQDVDLDGKFVADSSRPSTIVSALRPNQPRTRISAGSLPYFAFSVLYDGENGIIGLKPR